MILLFIYNNMAAIISFIGTVIIACMSFSNNKRTLKQQKEIAEKNLHANIISEARIEWIQEVRKIMADFLQKATSFNHYCRQDSNFNGTKEETTKSKLETVDKYYEIQALMYL